MWWLSACRSGGRTSVGQSWQLLAAFAISLGPTAVLAAPPKINHFFPSGCQRGQSVSVVASGDFSTWPPEVWVDRPGLSVSAEKDKGKFKVEAAADAVPGVYWLRAYNRDGAAALRPLIVGTLAEVAESEPNDGPDKPQAVEPKVTINGKLGRSGDVDGYRVLLNPGQTLVASLQANSILGAPMDAVMQVCELVERPASQPASRQVEAYVAAQNHDAVGLDPQIAFTAPRGGEYLVRVFAFPATPDSSIRFAGGDDYVYRLTLTTGPFIDHALPLAAPREEAPLALGGWNLEAAAAAIVPPLSAESSPLTPPDGPLAWIWRPDAAGAIALPRTDVPLATGGLRGLAVPSVASGRLLVPGQIDRYEFQAQKEQKLRIRVAAKALGFPTDPVISIADAGGKPLAEADDSGRDDRDPQLEFSPPQTGTYQLLVRDLAGRGDERLVYRLSIDPVQPDFSLSLTNDSLVLEQGKPLEIPINVAIRDGLREPIAFHVIGLPAGISAEPLLFQPSGDSPMADAGGGRRGRRSGAPQQPAGPSVKLVLKADAAAALPGGFAVRIEGRTGGGTPLVRSARFPLNLPLAGQHHALWVSVKK